MATVKLDPAKGVQIPNLTTSERNAISSPETGALIWNTTTSAINQYNGSAWSAVDTSTDNTKLPLAGGTLTGDLDISDTGVGALTVGGTTNAYSAPVLFTVSDLGLDVTDGTKHLASWATHGGSSHAGSAIGTRSNHDLALITNDTKRVIINTAGKVGIGVTALTRQLAIGTLGTKTDTGTKYVMNIGQTTESSGHAGLGVYFVGHANAASRKWQFQPAEAGVANDGIIEMNPDGGYFRANRGVLFGTDTAAANILDDYEEGTWTVGWSSTNNSFNPSTTTGYYTKIGNLVTVTYHAYLAGAPTINSAANGFSFTGLPFTSSSGKTSTLTWGHKRWMEWPANTTDVFLQIPAVSTTIETLARTGIGEMYNIRAQAFSRNGSAICFAGHYYTDS